MYRFRDNKKKF
jgi:hypothetical protein